MACVFSRSRESSWSGAERRKIGRFELANGGTLLLDEAGDIPPALQAKLLRVLQTGQFERVGGTETIQVDVRIIAASHKNLEDEVQPQVKDVVAAVLRALYLD